MFCLQFDVVMRSIYGGEVCGLVVRYAIDVLIKEFGDDKVGFSRDDGLSCFQDLKFLNLKG